jgi:hypothetical protein
LRVPECNPDNGVVCLLLGFFIIVLTALFSHQDNNGLAHFALGLCAFADAALYFMPDDRRREKAVLLIAGLAFLLVVVLPLLVMSLDVLSSDASWILALLVLFSIPLLILWACLEYAYHRQKRRA